MTPREFLADVLKVNLEDYISLMSFMSKPFYEYGEYEVEANWWHCGDYYNVPLDVFYAIIKQAVQDGLSVELNGDVSESGFCPVEDAAVIPSFDIVQGGIDQSAREIRFKNKATTDDHDFHLVGYTRIDGFDWFLIKDSASFARSGRIPGYWFCREDYIKLKILSIIVHKDAVKTVIHEF
jgi:bleomycin hydrolase